MSNATNRTKIAIAKPTFCTEGHCSMSAVRLSRRKLSGRRRTGVLFELQRTAMTVSSEVLEIRGDSERYKAK